MAQCPFCQTEADEKRHPKKKPEIYGCASCLNPFRLEWEGGQVVGKPLQRANDVRQAAPEGSIGAMIIGEIPKAVEKLPVMPDISRQVLNMVNDPEVSMQDLADLIRQDQVIALKIMRLANSALYGGLDEIKDLSAACARLGMKTIANAVQAVANGNLFVSGDPNLKNYMRNLWRHSIASAHAASDLANTLSMPRSESAFMAGLIHDVGKLIIIDIISSAYSGPLRELRERPEILVEVVARLHPLAGLQITQAWDLPAEFSATTYCHPDPEQAPNEDHLPRVHVVAAASAIARAEGFTTRTGDEEVYLTSHNSCRYLGLNDLKLAGLRVDLSDKVEALLEAAA